MDFLHVLRPTLWTTRFFGLSTHMVTPNGARKSKSLKLYSRCFYAVGATIQICWFFQHLYFKFTGRNLQELLLFACIACNIIISLLPLRNVTSDNENFFENLFVIYWYEKEIFTTGRRVSYILLSINVTILVLGFTFPVMCICLEVLNIWNSYSIGKHHIITDITAALSGFLRPSMDVVFLNGYIMYILVYGTSYANINASLSRPSGMALGLQFLKHLERLDNALKDFCSDVMFYHTWFCVFISFLAFLNWFYVVGFVFLSFSAIYKTYTIWVIFFTAIFLIMICGSVYAQHQVDRTAVLLHQLYVENDDPRTLEEVEILSLQLLHRKVEFDACGFFKLDFSQLLSMIGTVTTYVLILVQFENKSSKASRETALFNSVSQNDTLRYLGP